MSAIATRIAKAFDHAEIIGRKAVHALYSELVLYPKPGLVSPVDNGSHDDMCMRTFMRSLSAIRGYFVEIAAAGAGEATFAELQALGLGAERRMLAATGGINTHRGAIFSLGLLAAAAGYSRSRSLSITDHALGATVAQLWGTDISNAKSDSRSHGSRAARRYRVGGARQQAVEGFPILFEIGVPVLQSTLRATGSLRMACIQTLFSLMADLDDTNVLHRGGAAGLLFVQNEARAFLSAGGVYSPDWRSRAIAFHRACVKKRLSPGGAADLLAAATFVHRLQAAR